LSLKEGYQPTKKTELQKAKAKPKPNILDKAPIKKANSKESSPSPPASPAPALTSALTQRIEELVSELQKMKAIILKHEVRIRDLEKRTDLSSKTNNTDGSLDNHNTQAGAETLNNNGESVNLLPDEV